MVLATYSYSTSTWLKGGDDAYVKPYKLCKQMKENPHLNPENKLCPDIAMEKFFVAMTIICFIGSGVSLVFACCGKLESSRLFRWLDAGSHGVRAVLLAAGAIMFAVSAELIRNLDKQVHDLKTVHFRRDEKIAAAVSFDIFDESEKFVIFPVIMVTLLRLDVLGNWGYPVGSLHGYRNRGLLLQIKELKFNAKNI